MTYYRDPKTRTVWTHRELEQFCKRTKKSSANWIVEDYIKTSNYEDVTSLYEWLAEKYLWSDEEEKQPIDFKTAAKWLEYWKEDYEEFYSSFNPYNVTTIQIVDVWFYIITWGTM